MLRFLVSLRRVSRFFLAQKCVLTTSVFFYICRCERTKETRLTLDMFQTRSNVGQ